MPAMIHHQRVRAPGADDIVARFNELLNSLREAGLLRLP